jgi:hypothetical protein
LACKKSTGSSLGDDYLFEEEEKVVEPASRHQIVDKVAHPVSPDLLLA